MQLSHNKLQTGFKKGVVHTIDHQMEHRDHRCSINEHDSSYPQMDQLSDEEVEVREEEEEEEDSDKEDQDLDKMFGAWLGELDKLTQVHRA